MKNKIVVAFAVTTFLTGLYGCGDSNSTSADPTPQSSAAVESSSSVADTPANPEVSSSSATMNPAVGEVACGDLWCGKTDKVGHLITGYEDESSGWWYLYNDNYAPDNGNSMIVFPGKLNDWGWNDGDFYGYLAEEFGGIKASVVIGNDYEYPYAGFGFNIVNEDQVGGDIIDWGGLCLVYSSTAPFEIRIDVENQTEAMGNEHYSASVPASETLTAVNLPWEKFRLPYGSPNKPEDILKKAAAVKLRFEQSGDFFLKSIGREGTCPAAVVPESSSSSISSSSSSSSSVKPSSSAESTGELKASFLWKGDDTEGRVITGSPDETSGYWYSYDDSYPPNNGNSKIVFPSDVVEDEFGNFFGPLNVKYGGIKADIQIGPAYENGFVGLGFNIWSENQEGVDITKWEGVCLTYSSAESFAVQLRVEDEATTTEYCSLQWIVPKSDVLTTVSYPWSKLYSSCGWGGFSIDKDRYLQKVSSITLKFSKSGEFLLKEIGSLDACGK